MIARTALALSVLSLTLAFGAARAQQAAPPGAGSLFVVPQIDPAARREGEAGLQTFKKLVTERNFRTLGFTSLGEAQSATLGLPLADYHVPLDKLRAYVPGSEIKPLLTEGTRVVFPVLAAGSVRSSIMVARTGQGRWKAATFGAPRFMRAFAQARENAASASGRPASDLVLVRVPALNAQFLAFSSAGTVLFVVVQPDRRFDLRGGETLPAAEVLGRMVEAARRLDPAAPG